MTRAIGIAARAPEGNRRHTRIVIRFILHFVVRMDSERPRGDRGLVWAAKNTTLCENESAYGRLGGETQSIAAKKLVPHDRPSHPHSRFRPPRASRL